jgi:orotate phosphoribosyltransferase
MSLEVQKSRFFRKLLASEAVDPEKVHHEFNQGLHGQKIDFDTIETGSKLFWLWVDLVSLAIKEYYSEPPDVLVGVANGTNRIVEPVSRRLGGNTEPLKTMKSDRSSPVLTAASRRAIQLARPSFVLVIEDVGNMGTNALSVARSIQEEGTQRVEVLNTIQRSVGLELLRKEGISYRSVLVHILQSYTPDECQSAGYCQAGWKLIPYKI